MRSDDMNNGSRKRTEGILSESVLHSSFTSQLIIFSANASYLSTMLRDKQRGESRSHQCFRLRSVIALAWRLRCLLLTKVNLAPCSDITDE